jgi:hypothetical protein
VKDEIEVEYDYQGRSTGVEREPRAEAVHEPFDPAEIDVQTRVVTVDLMLTRIREGLIDLAPGYQRSVQLWNEAQQGRLIESLLLRIPLSDLYAAESGADSWVIVDGIQRIRAIARFIDPALVGAEPLRLHGLEYLQQYEGFGYAELPGNLQTRIKTARLTVHLIRAGTPDVVKFNIFSRINSAGRALTAQELRHSLIPGPARDLLTELARGAPFLNATRHSVSPVRMADAELVLRFLAFRLTDPDKYRGSDLNSFLRQAMQRVNDLDASEVARLTAEFTTAMDAASAIFGEHAFRKRAPGQDRRLPLNKALFEAISVNLAKMSRTALDELIENREEVTDLLIGLMGDAAFLEAISFATGDEEKVHRRFAAIEELFQEVIS